MFWCRSDQPQVNRNVISSIVSLVDKLPHELPNYSRLKILGNKEISNLDGDIDNRYKTLYKIDIKLFLSYPVLLDFSFLGVLYMAGLIYLGGGGEYTWKENCVIT